jgi:hypothetical protein
LFEGDPNAAINLYDVVKAGLYWLQGALGSRDLAVSSDAAENGSLMSGA